MGYWTSTAVLALWFVSGVNCTTHSKSSCVSTKSCASACVALNKALPGKVTTSKEAAAYKDLKTGFYTTFNSDLNPACFVLPAKAEDVAIVVKTAKALKCPFATKSGGHTCFAGASNIQDGITIDLRHLNKITPVNEHLTRVGPGLQWKQVYDVLDPLNRTVFGGRVGSIGVGGLLLSGGISFLHAQHGFGCDNVKNYQLVNADGKILEVNQTSDPDLFWALRGGSSNFGLITRFDLDTKPHGRWWGGTLYYDIAQLDKLVSAFGRLAQPETKDLKASTWLALAFVAPLNTWTISALPVYSDPVTTTPEVFKPFLAAEPTSNTISNNATLSALTSETTGLNGTTIEWDITMKMNNDVPRYIYDRINQGALKHPLVSVVAISLQILGKEGLSHASKRGGNALGISAADGPLLLVQVMISWNSNATAEEDSKIIDLGKAFMADLKKWSVEKKLSHRYIYLNYAGPGQDVFAGYGHANLARLKRIAKKHDPDGVFQHLMPGGKKLFHKG